MSDFWHGGGCCVVEKPQPVSTSSAAGGGRGRGVNAGGLTAFVTWGGKRRRRIDRSMIGEPMNGGDLTHIGSGDMAAGEGLPGGPPRCGRGTGAVQEMRSRGGRERQWSNSRVL
ncbi:C42S1 protein, partial [Pteruthius melanotis]|nr:C42S1 protein [Pteruthius melanotis]